MAINDNVTNDVVDMKVYIRDNDDNTVASVYVSMDKTIIALIEIAPSNTSGIYIMRFYPAKVLKDKGKRYILCMYTTSDMRVYGISIPTLTDDNIIGAIKSIYTFFDKSEMIDNYYTVMMNSLENKEGSTHLEPLTKDLYWKWDDFNAISGYKRRFYEHTLLSEEYFNYQFARIKNGSHAIFISSDDYSVYDSIMYDRFGNKIYRLPEFKSVSANNYYMNPNIITVDTLKGGTDE